MKPKYTGRRKANDPGEDRVRVVDETEVVWVEGGSDWEVDCAVVWAVEGEAGMEVVGLRVAGDVLREEDVSCSTFTRIRDSATIFP